MYAQFIINVQFIENAQFIEFSQFIENAQFLENAQFIENAEFIENSQFLENAHFTENARLIENAQLTENAQFGCRFFETSRRFFCLAASVSRWHQTRFISTKEKTTEKTCISLQKGILYIYLNHAWH